MGRDGELFWLIVGVIGAGLALGCLWHYRHNIPTKVHKYTSWIMPYG